MKKPCLIYVILILLYLDLTICQSIIKKIFKNYEKTLFNFVALNFLSYESISTLLKNIHDICMRVFYIRIFTFQIEVSNISLAIGQSIMFQNLDRGQQRSLQPVVNTAKGTSISQRPLRQELNVKSQKGNCYISLSSPSSVVIELQRQNVVFICISHFQHWVKIYPARRTQLE